MKLLVTGVAGFIGAHLVQRLLARGDTVVGVDNLSDYYDVNLKKTRLQQFAEHANFTFLKLDLADRNAIAEQLAPLEGIDQIVHLAAQAGVRYSLTHPESYVDSNLVGFANVLELARHKKTAQLVFASSSSVYGANTLMPFSETHNVDHPISLYAATKKSNELMAHSYAHLYDLPCTGVRFFTVYGPWGRPDMALFKFTKAILEDTPIDVYNHGDMVRDLTYVDDIVEGLLRMIDKPAVPSDAWQGDQPNPAISYAPYRIYNIGNNNPVTLLEFISTLEEVLQKEATKNFLPMQAGDVQSTHASTELIAHDLGYTPKTHIREGIQAFVDWYRGYYKI
jgi:UDP-glucuronate 4-epimerase